jgi:predicted amidohydrolase
MAAEEIQLFAVQARWSLADYRDPEAVDAFVRRLMAAVEEWRRPELPCLVAFPEFIGLPLLFLGSVPLVEGCARWTEAVPRVIHAHEAAVSACCARFGVSPQRGLMLARAEAMEAVYTGTFSRAAAAHRCHLAAGSLPTPFLGGAPEDGSVYNVAYLFGPAGELIGKQGKVHPYGLEGSPEGLDITAAPVERVRVFPTELGRIGIAVCYDAWQEDVMSRLEAQGAQFLIQPSANPRPWDAWQADDWQTGLWQGVQASSSARYGVNPMMVGSLFAPGDEYSCQGRSSIIARAGETPAGSGYLARATARPWGEYLDEEVVSAVIRL